MTSDNAIVQHAALLQMSQNDLKKLGLDAVGYIRRYSVNNKPTWVLHAADGTALAVQQDATAARLSATHYNLDLVPVH